MSKQTRPDLSDDEDGPAPPPTRYDSHRPVPPSSSRNPPENPTSRSRTARKSKSPESDDSPHETSHSSKRISQKRDVPEPISRPKASRPSSKAPSGDKAKVEESVSSSPPQSPGATEGNPFTNRDKKRCLQEYDNIMALDEDQTIDAWITWGRLVSAPAPILWSYSLLISLTVS